MNKIMKRVASATLITALVASSSLAIAPAEAKTFTDVSKTHWAYSVIDQVSDSGIMNGTGIGIFAPKMILSRAQYAGILYNLAPNKENGSGATNFSDVPDNVWYKAAAQWAVSNGIIFKQGGTKFNGNGAMSREAMADATYRFIKTYYPDALDESDYDAKFADADKFGGEYLLKVANILAHNGLVSGRGNNMYAPKATLTRAEAAAMASRIMHFVDENNPVVPPEKPEQPEQPQEPEKPPVKPEEPQQPVDPKPEQPQKPEKPPVEQSKPYPGDENAPEWMIKIEQYTDNTKTDTHFVYITKPEKLTSAQWEELKNYYKDKEKPATYPYKESPDIVPAGISKKSLEASALTPLYDVMQKEKAKTAIEEGNANLSAEEQKMVELVNKARREAGVPELIVSPKLCEAARIRAKEANIKYSHTRPDGSSCDTVLEDVGLDMKLLDGNQILGYSGNLAGSYKLNYSATQAFQAFVKSDKHYKNMLNKYTRYIGVGFDATNKESAWIQSFSYMRY